MNDKYPTLGEKIRMFRKRAGISQSNLELEIDASFGSLSRIENDQTNPTKETLMKIAKVLNLREDEISYLFQIRDPEISEEDIENIIKVSDKLFEEIKVPAYVCDYRQRIWNANQVIYSLLDLKSDFINENRGVSIDSLLFDRTLPIYNMLTDSKREQLLKQQILKTKRMLSMYQSESWFREVEKNQNRFQKYKHLWESIDVNDDQDVVYGRGFIYFTVNNSDLEFAINQSILFLDRRFLIVEYFPNSMNTFSYICNIQIQSS